MAQLVAPPQGKTQAPVKGRGKSPYLVALELFLALALVLAVPEAIFALAGVGEQEYIKPHPTLGFVPMEGKPVTWRSEGFSRLRLNRFGMADQERSQNKPAGTFRIAVIGDSITMALEVDRQKTYCHQLEELLNQSSRNSKDGRQFEVLNFAVSSYNLGQEYLMLKERALSFHPDLVILPVRVDGVLQLAPNPKGGFLYARPSFFLGPDHRLIADYTVQELWSKSADGARVRNWSWFRRYSRIWGVISNSIRPIQSFVAGWQETLRSPLRLVYRPPAKNTLDYSAAGVAAAYKPDEGSTRFLWPIADALLGQVAETCKANHCRLLVVRLPATGRLHNDAETALLRQSVAKYNLPYFDLTPIFDAASKNYFYVFHFTPEGHQLVARTLFHYLTESGQLKKTEDKTGAFLDNQKRNRGGAP